MQKINIYTEDKGNISELTAKFFDSFTLLPSVGYWKGKEEKSVVIVIIVLNRASAIAVHSKAIELARKIKQENKQEAVLVESTHGITSLLV